MTKDIDRFWATEMAMAAEMPRDGIHCTVQRIYPGVQLFRRDQLTVVASPPERASAIAERVRDLPGGEIFSVEFVARLLSPDAELILGPARVAYADASTFQPSATGGCRALSSADTAVCKALAAAMSSVEMEQSGFDPHDEFAFGAFAEGLLCAVASYRIWEPGIAHITVATHPDHRRQGYGRAAVSALAEQAFERGLVLQYRALESNVNSLALGRSLGFRHYCSTIYVRLSVGLNG